MYRADWDAGLCARGRVGARTQRTGSKAPGRTGPFGSSHEPENRTPTRESKNARSDGGGEGLACAAVAETPRPARSTGRARRESGGSCFWVWRQKTPMIPTIPTNKKIPRRRARAHDRDSHLTRARAVVVM